VVAGSSPARLTKVIENISLLSKTANEFEVSKKQALL